LIAQNKPGEAFAYAERAKARTLLDVLDTGRINITKAMTGEEREQELIGYHQMISLNAQIRRESSRPKPDAERLADFKASLQKARLQRDVFQANLYAAHPELQLKRGETRVLNTEEAADLLPAADTALLEYVVTGNKTFLFVLTKTTKQNQSAPDLKVYTIHITEKQLASRADGFRRQLAEHDLDFRSAATQLYDVLLRPAQVQLAGKSNVVIVPDGALWLLPFHALQPGPDRYLLEETAVSYAPSLTALRQIVRLRRGRDSSAASTSLLALGNPTVGEQAPIRAKLADRDMRLDQLPQAEAEVSGLGQLYGSKQSRVYTGADAREDRLKAEAGKYDVVHIAAHAVLDDASPMYSHIVLS
ncbi:MAG: hypothetical protein DMF60_03870, partial [Acidobacteria bacterium]